MRKISHFILYNNFVPVMFGILFLGAGATFAASPEARDAVISSERVLKSVDNSYIVAADLPNYQFGVRITEVTEDSESYFVAYEFSTIDLVDGMWRDVTQEKSLTVSKALLGERDLGIYISEELSEVRDTEKRRLVETQKFERGKGQTQKVISTVYSGLVGRVLSPKDETFEGYTPVIEPQIPSVVASVGASTPTTNIQSSGSGPGLVLIGNNPAEVALNARYTDLGVLFENPNDNFTIHTFLNGESMDPIDVDTNVADTHTIRYEATDASGAMGFIERTVIVGDGGIESPIETTEQATTTATTTQVIQSEPTQEQTTNNIATSSESAATTTQESAATTTSTIATTTNAAIE